MADELRSIIVRRPPSSDDPATRQWMEDVTNAINQLPFSIFSTTNGPNESGVTAPQGFIGIDVGSSTTKFWVKNSGSTSTGWSHFSFIGG